MDIINTNFAANFGSKFVNYFIRLRIFLLEIVNTHIKTQQ